MREDEGTGESAEDILRHAPCGFVSTLPDGTLTQVNERMLEWTGLDREHLLSGVKFQDLLTVPGRVFYETHFAPLLHMRGFVREIACNLRRRDRTALPILISSNLRTDAAGRPLAVRTVVFDATERTAYERDLRLARRRAEQRAAVVDQSKDAIVSHGFDSIVQTWNNGAARLFGYTPGEAVGQNIDALIFPGDPSEENARILEAVDTGQQAARLRSVRRTKNGALVPVEINASLLLDEDDRPWGLSVIFQDITEIKQAEDHRELLLAELNHRVKNSLATIQAMAAQTLRHAPSLEAFRETFLGRLRAIASAHDIITITERSRVGLRDLIGGQVGPYADAATGRMRLTGPDLVLDANTAHGLGLILHELATNAVKYGALANPSGRVEIEWTRIGDDGRAMAELRWSEHGGPVVIPPRTKGFGSRLIETTLAFSLGGNATLAYDAEGFNAVLLIPLKADHA